MTLEVLNRLVNYYHENKISHVYLVETNNVEKCLNDIKDVIKQIFCASEYSESCDKCNICNLINQNYLPSLQIIEPDGSSIKKDQILELKRKFNTVPVMTKENIYIVKNAELMNAASANTMLKFLEEPEEHIIGFFITNNLNSVIPTIRSRCEVLKAVYDVHELTLDSLLDDKSQEYLQVIKKYLEKVEVEKKQSIMYNRSILLEQFNSREDIKKIFQIMLLIYEEFLKKSFNFDNKCQNLDGFDYLSKLSSKDILFKINLIVQLLEDINSNVNLELLLDKYIIDLGGLNG